MKKTTLAHFYNNFIIALLFVMGATVNTFAQCPTVTIPTLSFCDVETPTVLSLAMAVTDNGGGIKWYETATSTTALLTSQVLQNNKNYFADNNSGTCGSRQSVTVEIYGKPASNPQIICVDSPEDATVSRLLATGNNLQWYTQPSGGSPLLTSTLLINGTYYVDQSNPNTGCRTSRRPVSVTIGNVVGVPTGDEIQEFCAEENPTLADLEVSGPNRWYGTLSSSNPLDLSTPLVDGGSYYATTYDFPCESDERLLITVKLIQPNNAGNYGEIEICESGLSSTNTVNLFEALLGTPDSKGTWTGPRATSNDNIGTVDVSTMTVAGSPYLFTYTVSSDTCPTDTATVSIMITESGNPGTDGTLSLCVNSPSVNLIASLKGNPEPGGTWSPALTSGTGIFDATKDNAGVYTYTVYGVPPCGSASATVTVSINVEPQPGTNGNLTLCSNSTPENLFNRLGGAPQSGGTWTPALASGTGIFDPTQDAEGVYTYTVFGTAPCEDASATVTVNITPLPNPGTNGSLVLCNNDGSKNLFDSLGGTPETGGTWSPVLASGTSVFDPSKDAAGIFTYTLNGTSPCGPASAIVNVSVNPEAQPGTNGNITLCVDGAAVNLFDSLGGSPQSGGIWSPALASGTGVFDPSLDAAGTYTYTISGIAPCADATSSVTVTVNSLANAGTNGSLSVCSSDASQDLFNSLGDTPDAGGIWSPALASGTGVFDPSKDVSGTYTYTVNGVSPCGNATATVKVTVNPESQPGINGNLLLCIESAPENLFNSLDGTPQSGGTWSPALVSGTGVFDPLQDAPGEYTYTISGIAPCGDATSTVTVTVTVNPLSDAGSNGSLIICSSDAAANLFDSLTGTPQSGGTWSPALVSGTGIFNPAQDTAGIYTYTVKGILPCGDDSATVDVTVNPGVEPGINGSLALCVDSAPKDLFASLGGTPQSGGTWSPALASGTGVFDPSKDTAGIYIYTITGIAPCGDATATVTVIVNPLASPGSNGSLIICSSDASADLLDSLGGTPDVGGTWLPALASGTGIFNPAQDAAGIYTYTVKGLSPCGNATSTVEVTVNPEANPGTNGNLTLCDSSAPEDLFESLGGSPQLGGSWLPALASATGVFDPSMDAAGIYTYTISGSAPCGNASATVTVTINPLLEPGTNGSLIVCENGNTQDLFDSLGGTPVTGGTWYPALASGTGMFDPSVDAAGIYTYTITTDCGQASASVEVTVSPQANPGINGNLSLCFDGSPTDIFSSLGGTPQSGGTWSPALASGTGVFDPSLDAAGIYTYTVSGITPCGNASATVTVKLDTAPQAGLNGRFAICTNDAPRNLFDSLGGTPETIGTWSPGLASGSGIFDPAQDIGGSYTYTVTNACGTDSAVVTVALIPQPDATALTLTTNNICLEEDIYINLSRATLLINGNYSLTYALSGANTTEQTITINITDGNSIIFIPASQLTTSGTTTFTILNLLNPITNCGTAPGALPKVDFNVEEPGTLELINDGNIFCEEDAATIADLTSRLNGADLVTWFDTSENGNAYSSDTPLVDGYIYFASNATILGCSNDVRLAVRVNIDLCEPLDIIIPDGFSPNGDTINDDFFIKNLRELYPNFQLQIYNRYGNILYKGDKNTPNWDGTSNKGRGIGSGILPVGVYYYILELKDTNNKSIQGSVYLNR